MVRRRFGKGGDSSASDPPQVEGGSRRVLDSPRRRGARFSSRSERTPMPELQCHFCGAPVAIGEPIPRDSECESCRHDLRCCRNCRHWDPRYHNECMESMADPVEDKTRRNFCEYFYFSREPYAPAAGGKARESEARAKLEGLFGGAPSKPADAREKLGKLFGDAGPKKPSDARDKLDALFRKPKPESTEESKE